MAEEQASEEKTNPELAVPAPVNAEAPPQEQVFPPAAEAAHVQPEPYVVSSIPPQEGYESIFILDPGISEQDQADLVVKLRTLVEQQGGEVLRHVVWGRRRLAYVVKKHAYGIYHVFYLNLIPQALHELEQHFRLNERVIKWLSVRVKDVSHEHAEFIRLLNEGSRYRRTTNDSI